MYKFIRMWVLVAALFSTAGALSAATPSEFYQGLLRRGTASYEANRYTDAAKQLRIAAFGMVEAVDQYQLAQIYLTLTYDKLSDSDRAREAARRVAAAERIERKYAGLPLPDSVRTAFESVAGKLLSPSDSATLLRGAEMTVPPPQTTKSSPQTPRSSQVASAQKPPTTPRRTTTPPQTKPQTAPAPEPRNTIPAPQTSSPENAAPQTTAPQTTAPQTVTAVPPRETPKTATVKTPPAATAPAPQTTKPTQPATTQPRPAAPSTASATKVDGAETGRGGPSEAPRPAAPAPAPRTLSASEVAAKLASAERGLNSGNLSDARRGYRELLGVPGLEHETLIRVAEGLYRARDFSGALSTFNRVGTLRRGEEPYRYYIAVALYETGDLARAKKELAAALPFIEVTPDVARYRIKIEGAP